MFLDAVPFVLSMARLLIVIVIAVAASRCSAIFPFNLEAVDVVVTNVKDHLDDTIDPYLVPAEHDTYGQSPYGYVPQKYVNEPICPLYIKPVWEEAVVSVFVGFVARHISSLRL